ncbi:MAG: SpoIID/LytB domain-containing protein [Candidatus Zixiibacteriota bacterium]
MMTEPTQSSTFHRIMRIVARIGAGLCLMALVWSCATVPGLREERGGTYIRIPFVRVLLADNSGEAVLGANQSFAVECLSGGEQRMYYSSQPVKVRNNGLRLEVTNHRGDVIQGVLDEVNIIPRGAGNRVRLNDNVYRGIMKVLPDGHNVQVINIIYMEDYLRGVVPPEIGKRADDEIEAVKAQAVAARTYAMAHLKQYEGQPYDMKSSITDQVYEGVRVENVLVSRAIDATAGRVAMFHDELINAYYHSTCGGMTDNIAHVWDRKETPYLRAVSDGGACSWSKYYRWRETFTERQLRGRVEQYLASDRGRDLRIGVIRDVSISERTPGGRVARLLIHTDREVYKFHKDRIRWVIGRTSNPDLILPSDRFDVTIDRDGAGNIRTVTFKGSGYGHGVGMCQCGAIGLSRTGWTFDRILRHYYAGVGIEKLY